MRTTTWPWAALSLPVLLTALPARVAVQDPPPRASTWAVGLREACGLQAIDGALWGIGPDYKASFRADGVEFTPALGAQAPRNLPLALRLLDVGRDGAAVPATAVEPEASGLKVRYRRGSCVERYDVSARGLALSFVFGALPAGGGDLVVRLALATELPLVAAAGDGLRFEWPGIGGVAIGGVTGIDARGERASGSIACDGSTLTLRLPAAFVDGAALPLVLDPQIGTVVAVTSSTLDYQAPEVVAPFPSGSTFLCVFERAISATDRDVRGIRLDSNGSVVGALFAVTTGTGDDHAPTAAGIAVRSAWLAVYERGGDLFVRSISATGVVGTEHTAVSGADAQVEPDLGSETSLVDDDALLVYRNSTQNTIQATYITLFSSGPIATAAPTKIATGTSLVVVGRPRISHDGGDAGRWLVVYPRTQGLGDTKPQLVLLDRDVTVLATVAATNTTDDEDSAVVDGNGTHWVVAFESEANELSGDNDIHAVSVYYDPVQGTLAVFGNSLVTGLVNVDEIDPAIACFRDGSCMIAWRRRAAPGSSDTEVFMKTIDQLRCFECEPTVLLANSNDVETNLTAAASASVDNRGLMLWETSTGTGQNGDLNGVAWDAEDGSFGQLPVAAGCHDGLFQAVGCARIGNSWFSVRLQNTDGTSTGTFVLSTGVSQLLCGGCRLYADPYEGLAFYPVVGGFGVASFGLAIPDIGALRGMTFYTQWLMHNPAAQCSWLQADFSNALTIVIE
ncbi:MAG: hypothetical protein JNL08_04475 [Planctomycetes bacterium]|nr:hypothetical protein [Planctomycetota bacterium]